MRNALLALGLVSTLACGVAASTDAESTENALTSYRVETSVTPSLVQPGSDAELAIRVMGATDAPVTKFDDLHTMPMHVVAVSSDLQDFLHVHPKLAEDGTLRVTVPIARAQPYAFFYEYDPEGADGPQTSRSTLRPAGAVAVPPRLATSPAIFDGSRVVKGVAGDTQIDLQPVAHGMIMPNMAATLRIAVKTATGAPATDLVDWLGMPGHAIMLSEDTSTFLHLHAMPPGMHMGGDHGGHGEHGGHGGHGTSGGTTDAGPATPGVLEIADVKVPAAGVYKLFVQVKRGEDVITVPFVVRATSM